MNASKVTIEGRQMRFGILCVYSFFAVVAAFIALLGPAFYGHIMARTIGMVYDRVLFVATGWVMVVILLVNYWLYESWPFAITNAVIYVIACVATLMLSRTKHNRT